MSSLFQRVAGGMSAVAFVSLVASCSVLEKLGDHEGGPCAGKIGACKGGSQALICNNGKYAAVACRGPKGCSSTATEITCDTSLNSEADTCPKVWEDTGSCRGTAKWVGCHEGHYVDVECRGKKGCQQKGDTSTCDHSLVDEGDACTEDTAACSQGGDVRLMCKDGKMRDPIACRGPLKCHETAGNKIECDHSVVKEGDACQGEGAECGVDAAAVMICRNGAYATHHICRGPSGGCRTVGDSVTCGDMGIGELGDPCTGDVGACSVDGKALLKCKNGRLDVLKKCRACTSKDGSSFCP